MVSSLGSERYSFKIEFDHYDSTRTYHGLDKLSLNNLIQDSTMMKDYLTYTMMNGFGVDVYKRQENDRVRLLELGRMEPYAEVVDYMLEQGVKLEQEIVSLDLMRGR